MKFGKTLAAAAVTASFGLGALTSTAIADQPRMHSALSHLQAAKDDLQRADNDKGGHRRAAIASVNNAIRQVQAGIQFDRHH